MKKHVEGAAIRLENCSKTYGSSTRALEPVTLNIARGETVVLLGPSGCGKTTTLRMIAGLVAPDKGGRILFDDQDVTDLPIEKRNVGMVFQSYALFPNMTVAENVGYGLKIRGAPRDDVKIRVNEMLAMAGLEAFANRSIDQLSGGQRQRVALARAVAARPRVLLLDEPLTALDAALRERLRTDLDKLLRSLGITAIYVTHDQQEAMALGDRIVVMSNGSIAQIGRPNEIYFRPANRFVAEFVGAANIVEAPLKDGMLELPGGRVQVESGTSSRQKAIAMVRPEAISVVPPEQSSWIGRVESTSFLGDRMRVSVSEAASTPIIIDAPNSLSVEVGDRVGLVIPPSSVRLLPA
jgi:putative spermidine/putrescine transport system ATP-binding protein